MLKLTEPLVRYASYKRGQPSPTIMALRRVIEGMKSKNLPLALVFMNNYVLFKSFWFHAQKTNIQHHTSICYPRYSWSHYANKWWPIFISNHSRPKLAYSRATYKHISTVVVLDYYNEARFTRYSSGNRNCCSRYPDICVHDLGSADDPVNNLATAEPLLHSIEEASSFVGLQLNTGKHGNEGRKTIVMSDYICTLPHSPSKLL